MMEPWVKQIIELLEGIDDDKGQQAIVHALHVFKHGKGFLTNGPPSRVVFFGELHDRDAGK